MNRKKNKRKILFGPVITILILTFLIMFASLILSRMQFEGEITSVNNGALTSSLTLINNIFTLEGLKFLFSNIVTNFQNFEPLVILIISLIGISIGEASGLFDIVFASLKKINTRGMIILTLLLGIISSIIGDYNYIVLIPLIGVIYMVCFI